MHWHQYLLLVRGKVMGWPNDEARELYQAIAWR
jgi:hypothetical protein